MRCEFEIFDKDLLLFTFIPENDKDQDFLERLSETYFWSGSFEKEGGRIISANIQITEVKSRGENMIDDLLDRGLLG